MTGLRNTGSAPLTTLPVRFIVNGQAAAQGSKNAFVLPGTRRAVLVDTDKKLKPWRAAVAAAAAEARGDQPLLAGPVRVKARFIFPRPKSHFGTGRNADVLKQDAPAYVTKAPDVDKLQRAIGDSLTGVVYMDDSQIAEWQAVKVYGSHSCTQIEVTPLKGDAPSE